MGNEDIHGLAATIRSATASETFDFGGLPSTTIAQVVSDAFSKDFDLNDGEMIRLTLVVGAGKGNRSKYNPSALKIVTTSLSVAGYVEDRGASCVVESAGCYKFQHDTGKNLKTVVIFPKLSETKTNDSTKSLSQSSSLLPQNSLEYKIAVSTLQLFTNMLKFKFPSWFQKRSLLKLMDETMVEYLDKFDAVLMKGGVLSEDESKFYEQCVSVSEKKGLVKDAMSQQVKDGKLTSLEVAFLLDQVATRMEELRSKNQEIPNTLQERQAKLESIAKTPIPLPPLKHHATLGKLWKQAAPMMYLKSSGGKLLSPAETKKLGQLDGILCEIGELEESSRGFLEEDESYEERIRTYRRELQQRFGNISAEKGNQKKKRVVVVGASASKRKDDNAWNSTTKFQTPNFGTKGGKGWMSGKDKKSKNRSLNKGDLFGAMMADSDSDGEEDHEEEGDTSATFDASSTIGLPTATGAADNSGTKKKKKKKKNKSKAKGDRSNQDEDNALLDAAVSANNAASKNEANAIEEQGSGMGSALVSLVLSGLTELVFPFVLKILMWLVTSLFGKRKKNKKA